MIEHLFECHLIKTELSLLFFGLIFKFSFRNFLKFLHLGRKKWNHNQSTNFKRVSKRQSKVSLVPQTKFHSLFISPYLYHYWMETKLKEKRYLMSNIRLSILTIKVKSKKIIFASGSWSLHGERLVLRKHGEIIKGCGGSWYNG